MPVLLLVFVVVGLTSALVPNLGCFAVVVGPLISWLINEIVWQIRRARYFGSDTFKSLRDQVEGLVRDHNDVVDYVAEIRFGGVFELGSSASGQHAHLASFENASQWNYRRDRNEVEHGAHIHHASLAVVRRASLEPIKYLMKYFNIKPVKDTLDDVQRVANDIARLESAIENLKAREAEVVAAIKPPAFILRRYESEFWEKLGIEISPITVPYPVYRFQYVSAGGNSGQISEIKLDTPTLEALAETLAQKIRWAKSAAGQRALMTVRLRHWILDRDSYTCQNPGCGASVHVEPNLLLEVDHIIPISKGGTSEPENLQALCWRCNRSKGSRMPSAGGETGPA